MALTPNLWTGVTFADHDPYSLFFWVLSLRCGSCRGAVVYYSAGLDECPLMISGVDHPQKRAGGKCNCVGWGVERRHFSPVEPLMEWWWC